MDASVKQRLKQCDTVIPFLKVISNSTRLKILAILIESEKKVGDIQNILKAKQSYVSQQLKYLKLRGFVENRREGTQIYYKLQDKKFAEVFEFLRKSIK